MTIFYYPAMLAYVASTFAYVIDPSLASSGLFTAIVIIVVYWAAVLVSGRGMKAVSGLSSAGALIGTIIPAVVLVGMGAVYLLEGHASAAPLHVHNLLPAWAGVASLVLIVNNFLSYSGMEMNAVHVSDLQARDRWSVQAHDGLGPVRAWAREGSMDEHRAARRSRRRARAACRRRGEKPRLGSDRRDVRSAAPAHDQTQRQVWRRRRRAHCEGKVSMTNRDARATTSFLNCPGCGLSLEVRSRWMAIKHCPRCLGRTRTLVEMFSSPLPADVLYADSSRPRAAVGLEARPGPRQEPTG